MPRIRACDACYKKKIQCIIHQPGDPCDWCRFHTLACTFSRQKRSTKADHKFSTEDIQGLFERVAQLERALPGATTDKSSRLEPSPNDQVLPIHQHEVCSPRNSISDSPVEQSGPDAFFGASDTTPSLDQASPLHAETSLWQTFESRSHLGQTWFYKGTPILSIEGIGLIESRTRTQAGFGDFPLVYSLTESELAPGTPTSSDLPTYVPSNWDDLCLLPRKDVVEKTYPILLQPPFDAVFPVLDRILFEDTFSKAYASPDESPSTVSGVAARACVLATLSVASRFRDDGGLAMLPKEDLEGVSWDEDVCANKAEGLLHHIQDDASLESLQTVLMLQRHRAFTGRWQKAHILHSMACSMVCRLGGHLHQPENREGLDLTRSERQKKHTRKLFWICYAQDKDIALRSGRPPLLSEDYCDLTPEEPTARCSPGSSESILNTRAVGSIYETLSPRTPGQPSLGRLRERICRLLYSARAVKDDDGNRLLHIRHLDDELELWRSSIPDHIRPKLSIQHNYFFRAEDLTNSQETLRLNLQLEYNYLIIAIHATVRRCKTNSTKVHRIPEDLHNVLHSSTDLCLEASRSTLVVLKQCETAGMVAEAFHHIAFYGAIAAMSLFTNIIVHPADRSTLDDLDTLDAVAAAIRDIPLRSPCARESEYFEQMTGFVTRLSQLGRLAIEEAKRQGKTSCDSMDQTM